jgi:uncharacterized protein YkwD
MAVATMNRISISLLFLIMISMVLPTSAIMYANGSTDNSEGTSDGEFSENSFASDNGSTDNSEGTSDSGSTDDNTDSSSDSGSTDDNADLSTTPTENNPTLSSESPLSNNTENVQGEDLASSILAVHNQERAAVGVPPLVWSNELASGAQTWAGNLATTGEFAHDPNKPNGVGENIAGFNPSMGVSAPGEGQSLWVDEKKNWSGGVLTPENWYPTGHYTQMVWKDTQEVGCGTGSGDGHPFSILVCRYSPPGNFMGQAPY